MKGNIYLFLAEIFLDKAKVCCLSFSAMRWHIPERDCSFHSDPWERHWRRSMAHPRQEEIYLSCFKTLTFEDQLLLQPNLVWTKCHTHLLTQKKKPRPWVREESVPSLWNLPIACFISHIHVEVLMSTVFVSLEINTLEVDTLVAQHNFF